MPHRADRIELKPAQRLALAALNGAETKELTREQYQQLGGVSRSQAAYDLAELVERGVVERVGAGRSTRYRLARRSPPAQRHWTNERIRAALVDFCAGRTTWPSASEFKTAGHTDLYVAASRYGGIGFWASELGFSRPGRAPPARRSFRSMRPMLRSAAVGAAFAALLFGVAGTVLYPWHSTPARDVAGPRAIPSSAAGKPHKRGPAVVAAAGRARTAATSPKRVRAPRRGTPSSSSSLRRESGGSAYQGELAVQRVSAAPRAVVSQPRQPPTSSAAPRPLPAPSGGEAGAPVPLPAPKR
jgi:putative transcriptional regulator